MPNAFHGSEFSRLILSNEVTGFIALLNGENRSDKTEDSGDTEAALSEVKISVFKDVVSGNREHESRTGAVAGGNRVEELSLGPRAKEDVEEIRHFHSHRLIVEFGACRVLHPAVGDKNPEGG